MDWEALAQSAWEGFTSVRVVDILGAASCAFAFYLGLYYILLC